MSSDKIKKAIDFLKTKSLELDKIKNVQQGNTWKASLQASLTSYLGTDSVIISRLENLYFTKRISSNNSNVISSRNVYDENKKDNFKNLIESAISHIETHGILENKKKGNMFESFNNAQLIGGLFVAGTLVFGIGNFVGKIEKDREIVETNNKLQLLEDKYQMSIEKNKYLKNENEILKTKIELK
ncbi:hypothetical protein [Winogradskyella undariae]|uniref:hypothetical protein n=1 Tax=Winogradskyella undariae TaxID=1285465 RepID=UPI0015CE54D8|nr:hypothetical protein [Winogradskyella undariae]